MASPAALYHRFDVVRNARPEERLLGGQPGFYQTLMSRMQLRQSGRSGGLRRDDLYKPGRTPRGCSQWKARPKWICIPSPGGLKGASPPVEVELFWAAAPLSFLGTTEEQVSLTRLDNLPPFDIPHEAQLHELHESAGEL